MDEDLILTPGELPRRVRLFRAGPNRTSKGTVTYDPNEREAILENQMRQDGRDLYPIDIGHLSLTNTAPPEGHKAFGWFKLLLDDEGIWADEIEWTEEGKSLLKGRAFRYISPAFYMDDRAHVVQIVNFALTNEPATFQPLPIVASKETQIMDKEEIQETIEEVVEEVVQDKDELIGELNAQIATLQAENAELIRKVAELEAVIAEKEAEAIEAEKNELLEELEADKEEEEILKELDLEALRKLVQVRLSKKTVGLTQKKAPVVHTKGASAPANRRFRSLPTKDEIERLAKQVVKE